MAMHQETRSDMAPGKTAGQPAVPVAAVGTADVGGEANAQASQPRRRHLVIHVAEGGKPAVNVRIPLGLARAAGKFSPRAEKEQLKAQGIDVDEVLRELTGDELGPLVQVDEDGKSVLIAVE